MKAFWSGLLVLALAPQAAGAQSLADVARLEAQRRKQVKSGRVITNADLGPADSAPAQAPPTASPAAAPAEATAVPPEAKGGDGTAGEPDAVAPAPAKPREKRDEQYWRNRARDLRERLAKVEADVAGAESRVSDIDAQPGPAGAAAERQVMAAALARLQAEAQARREELDRFEAFARASNVPAEWTR
jgi:hypothetical protein